MPNFHKNIILPPTVLNVRRSFSLLNHRKPNKQRRDVFSLKHVIPRYAAIVKGKKS